MKKRIISALLTLCMALTFFPVTVHAATSWSLDDGTLTISGSGAMENYVLMPKAGSGSAAKLPDTPWYDSRADITAIVIESGVTYIGEYAFADCTEATSITIPASVTSVGYCAFRGCSALKTVNYGGSAKAWGQVSINKYDSSYKNLTNAARTYGAYTLTVSGGTGRDDYAKDAVVTV